MKFNLLIGAIALASLFSSAADAQVENTALGSWFKTQLDMIALPTAWQPFIGPGSILFVSWAPRAVVLHKPVGIVFQGKHLERPESDIPSQYLMPDLHATQVGNQHARSGGLDFSLSIAPYAPGLKIGRGTRIDYPQTEFEARGWGTGILDTNRVIKASPSLQQDLTSNTYDTMIDGQRYFQGFGQGYLVTAVFIVKKLKLNVVDQTQIDAGLSGLQTGACDKDLQASQINGSPTANPGKPGADSQSTQSTTAPPSPAHANSKGSAPAAPGAKTTFPSKIFSDVKVRICRYSTDSYTLEADPGVQLAFQAVELKFNESNMPVADASAKIQDLRDAMKHPD